MAAPIRSILAELSRKVADIGGQLQLVCSLAAGADIVAAEQARELGLPIHIILPKQESDFLSEDFTGPSAPWLDRAKRLLAVTSQQSDRDTDFDPRCTCRVAPTPSRSPDCYATVNVLMLEVADILFTVWNGDQAKSSAGTGHIVEQAAALGLPHVNLDPVDESRRDSRTEMFARPDDPGLSVFSELNHHVDCDTCGTSDLFGTYATCLENGASRSSRKFRSSTKWAILCHAVAGFIAALAAACYHLLKIEHYSLSYWVFAVLAFVELFLVGYGFYLEIKVGRNHEQAVWLDCRLAREIMRGLERANPFLDPLFPEIRRHRPKWERFGLSCSLQLRAQTGPLDPSDTKSVDAAKNDYIHFRLRDQKAHFTKQLQDALLPSKFFKRLAHLAGPIALVVVAIAFAAKLILAVTHGHGWTGLLKNQWLNAIFFLFLPVFVPLLASLSASFLASFDFGRRVHRYREMIDSLDQLERWLVTLHTSPSIQASIRRSEEILLDENIEWVAAQKSGFGH